MKWNEYTSLFDDVLNNDNNEAPYDNPEYVNYVKMNQSRSNRWLKSDVLNEELIKKIEAIDTPQEWIVITEPWCGDAAHNVPVIAMLSEKNPLVDFKIELRDNGKNMIDSYLTNGGKSIPKLIVRNEIGKEPFDYEGHTIVGYDDDAFRDFKVTGDKKFIVDAMKAPTGPAWDDFVEAVNNGSIFAIITARGHTPSVLKNGVYNLIKRNMHGLNEKEIVRNLRKYREIADEEDMTDDEILRTYLEMCKYHPVSFGEGSAANPEELKVSAMRQFMEYVKTLSQRLQEKAYMKNKISNYFTPYIGFSDDDLKNVETMKKHFDDESGLDIYHTGGGKKTKF